MVYSLREKTKNLKNSIGHGFSQMDTDFPQRVFKRFARKGGKHNRTRINTGKRRFNGECLALRETA